MRPVTLLVLDDPAAGHLRLLEELPESTTIAVGRTAEAFANALDDAEVIFAGLGTALLVEELWPAARRLRWIHSFSAGVEGLLFPSLLTSPVVLTNGRGAFSRPLAEFALSAILFFNKDLRRMVRSREAGRWDPFDVEEIHGKTLGIAGYGDIGQAVARLARGFGMRILALRRRPQLSAADPNIDRAFAFEDRERMLAQCDYVVVAAPLTPATRGLIGEDEIAALKPTAVVVNVGRGPVIAESALVRALETGRIRGAALDVFDQEPLPANHPFYRLDNVLLSPHCADHTPGWQDLGMRVFLRNFQHFIKGEPLDNVVDKSRGY